MARAAPQRECGGLGPCPPAPRSDRAAPRRQQHSPPHPSLGRGTRDVGAAPRGDPAAPCGLRHGPWRPSLRGSTCNVCAQRLEAPQEAAAKVAPGSRLWFLLLLVGAAAVPRTSADSHSYRHLYTAVSDPSPDMAVFTAVGYVDDQQILHYDSETRRQEPRGDWVQGAVDPNFWEGETMSLQGWQDGFKRNLVNLQHHYNQTGGSHTLQFTYGCEVRADGSTGGHMQLGYDGADFISYDLATRTWVAAPAQAQRTQHTWNEEKAVLQDARSYLEETCIAWLQQYLRHGEAALQSRRPVAQVSDRPSSRDGRTTLSCQVHGFYPRDVAVVWLKDGQAQPQETWRSGVVPSGDGTYQTRATIEMDPSSDHDYTCRVEHESLGAALRVAWDKGRAGYGPGMTVGVVIGAMLLVGAMTGTAGYFLRRRGTKPVRAHEACEAL
ncbi:class I histocompatibility antigen, F10 alpha chain-like [Alligator mississippiensis]|uniref:class I histocompatibility antigen, F10 alpha chain-like n=1 Tax=Alligator mississippiensis TaxID=8496 RepID=UPI002877F476|nr:class I histocompatibility antigen, F10 alpha chain-like [Alligator mississippiensis]